MSTGAQTAAADTTSPHAGLSPAVRTLLDAARACAALYVVAHHVAKAHALAGLPGYALRFGQEAVLVFFLLSGFVIFANERRRALHPRGYGWRRARRIYPPLIAALGVSTLIAWSNGDLSQRFDAGQLAGTLLAVQDIAALKPGVWADPYLGNDPLWSLSYEIAFYLIFPFALRWWTAAPRSANHAIGLACCLAYGVYAVLPNHIALVVAYFLVWWSGAMAAAAYLDGARRLRGIAVPLLWLLLLGLAAAAVVAWRGYDGFGRYPMLPLRHFASAAIMVVCLFGPLGRMLSRLAAATPRLWAGIAGVSYGLYVLHMPLLVDWRLAQSPAGLCGAAVLLVALAWAVERWLPRLLPRAPAS
ncbi:acyltransferase family protein [Sphingomonas sp. CLY1604]|uniref:acyltransferase family protein n=1 Tax=Sphingomonas sp. CLY1604 TaxID=3457786 RepID=UPI003FD89EEB